MPEMNVSQANSRNALTLLVGTLVFLIVSWSSGYTIREGKQVVITLFGKPVRMVKSAGLHWKLPFVEKVREIDLRVLNWDGYPNQIPTRDKKYITVDTTARWRIADPLKFIQSVQSETGARSRLDAILDATTRDIISSHNLVEAVRNSNSVFEVVKARTERAVAKAEEKAAAKDAARNAPSEAEPPQTPATPEPAKTTAVMEAEEEEVVGEIEKVELGREHLQKLIRERASSELASIGIDLIDVQIRRIMYESSVQKKVYSRMVSERERIAEKIRSIGKGQQAMIEGKTSREVQEIQSGAYRTSQKIKGEAEARAVAIYAATLSKDPAFFEFTRKLDAYKASIKPQTRVILSSGSEFFDVLQEGTASRK